MYRNRWPGSSGFGRMVNGFLLWLRRFVINGGARSAQWDESYRRTGDFLKVFDDPPARQRVSATIIIEEARFAVIEQTS